MSQQRSLSADQIGDIGRQLYGEHWQAPLARALGINTRLLRYWLSGEARPSPGQEQRLVALTEHAAAEPHRQARKLAAALQRPKFSRRWSFNDNELEIVNQKTIRHKPTGSEMSFYEYVTPPQPGDVPGGTICKMGDLDADDLQRFQISAWKKLAVLRYGRA